MISLLCPSRGRPEGMSRFANSAIRKAEGMIEIIFVIDDDDPASLAQGNLIRLGTSEALIQILITPRKVLSEYWNEAAKAATGEILGHMGDDIVFHTPGWDRLIEATFARIPDRIAFVHGADGLQDARLGTHGFVSRRWYETLGYFVPPHFSSDYNDTWLTELADRIERRFYIADLYTEHMHYAAGKGERDQTHIEREERGERDQVHALYASLVNERIADAEKLRCALAS